MMEEDNPSYEILFYELRDRTNHILTHFNESKSDLFSSGMCSAIKVSGSVHSTIQPCLSLTLPTSGFKKWFGTRLHITGVSISTSRRGGH